MGQHPELIKSMLTYVIVEPDEIETDYKKCYKFLFSLLFRPKARTKDTPSSPARSSPLRWMA